MLKTAPSPFQTSGLSAVNEIAIHDILHLSFSFDHRIIDGDLGGRFLNTIQRVTEGLTEHDLSVTKL